MDELRQPKQPKPAVLNHRMRCLRCFPAPWWWFAAAVLALLALGLARIFRAPDPRDGGQPPVRADVSHQPSPMAEKLAGAWGQAARIRSEQGRPAEALAYLVMALRADPRAEAARAMAEEILGQTVWHFPDLTIRHPLPVERLVAGGDGTMWVGMGGETCTVARWNLTELSLEAVLFPVADTAPRSMITCPRGKRMVLERADVLLLLDAVTLKPVADLGGLPQTVTPESVIVFSPDGLLFAHPADENGRLVWLLRDAQTGQVLRRHEPEAESALSRPLTAMLNRRQLRVLHSNGGIMTIPVSPVDSPLFELPDDALALAHAQYSADGRSWLGSVERGPLDSTVLKCLPADAGHGVGELMREWIWRFPWSRQPGIWRGLLRDEGSAPWSVRNDTLFFHGETIAPIHAPAPIHAVARAPEAVFMGCGDGSFVRFQLLPLPDAREPAQAILAEGAAVAAFANLAAALCGIHYDDDRRTDRALDAAARLAAARDCDLVALAGMFPALDFSATLERLRAITPRRADEEAIRPLAGRLQRADPKATALAAALESARPGEIADCLAGADDMPPLLRALAESRIAWLEGRKMAAIARWPEPFPDYRRLRLTQDWSGWERPDFGPFLETFRHEVQGELATLRLPENATPAQRDALFQRLTDPQTAQALGRPRLAEFCLQAADAFSAFADEAARTLALATIAYNFGAEPAASLRLMARAQAAAGDHEAAHKRWIELISDQPVESHLPGDYTEAAYTAFETSNSAQAMEILLAGIRRFPGDADYALRAGWIALLTDQAQHAYRFLLTGKQAGYAAEEIEHATVLLAIAAARSGEVFEADAIYEQLTAIHPDWSDPATIEALDWPEELKSTLRQFTW
ncbi:MAG: tetratricopeptide repeat protein [Luteolibacter sp.]